MASPPPGDSQAFLLRACALTGIDDRAQIERVVRSVLSVLGEQLPGSERAWFAQVLPLPLRPAVDPHAGWGNGDDLERFYQRVAAREAVSIGFAIEHARSVCRTLVESLGEPALEHLRLRLPDALQPLFDWPDTPAPPQRPIHPRPARNLASGRPTSSHPLSEAHPNAAQSESVARSDNPHADEKLSSSHGTTQEREGETLARGRPTPHHD